MDVSITKSSPSVASVLADLRYASNANVNSKPVQRLLDSLKQGTIRDLDSVRLAAVDMT